MGKSHISQYVAGKTMPREDVLEFLASELDVDTNWPDRQRKQDCYICGNLQETHP